MHDVNMQRAIWRRCGKHEGASTMDGGWGVGVQSTAVGVQRYSFATKRRLEVHGVPDSHEGVGGIVVQGMGVGVQCYSAPFV